MSRSQLHSDARDVFLATRGPGPWACSYAECDESISRLGRSRRDGCVHHLDEDPSNNDPVNLDVMHRSCHASHHLRGKPKSPEHAAKVRVAHLGHPHSEETKRKISEAKRGRK